MGREPILYTVIGFDDNYSAFVTEGKTAPETHEFARKYNLRGFHRVPTKGEDYIRKHKGGKNALAGSFLRRPDGSYGRPVSMQEWLDDSYHFAQVHPPA
jgi:hypothetical protein